MLVWLAIVLAGLVALFVTLSGNADALRELGGDEIVYVAAGGALALVYMVSLASDYRGRALVALRHGVIWLGLTLMLIVGYSYREPLKAIGYRVVGELLPPGQSLTIEQGPLGENAVRLRKHSNGHFLARSAVNGITIALLVDTGASTVVLKSTDAERIGIETGALSFSVPVSTANGTTFAAPIRLKSIAIGQIEVRDIEALVAKPGNLSESLLGMTFLKRLRSYEFSGDFLTLRG